jgi:hypothetical protein
VGEESSAEVQHSQKASELADSLRGGGGDRLEDRRRVLEEAGNRGMRPCSLETIFTGRGNHLDGFNRIP